MSLVAVPFVETLDKTRGNSRESFLESLSPYCCDPLLQFADVADFKDEKKLQRNLEEVLRIRRMGFPVKVLKQNWFPGLICIPVFHCQRCLALWTEAAQVPTFCSEVNRSVYGRIMPISITKCDLLTNLSKHDRPTTTGRLCKTQPKTAGTPDNNALRTHGANLDNTQHRKPKSVPVAEFMDIGEQLGKFRKNLSRVNDKKCLNNFPSNIDLLISGKENIAVASSRDDDDVNKEERNDVERDEQEVPDGLTQDQDPVFKHSSKYSQASRRYRQALSSTRRPSNTPGRSEAGYIARPPTRTSLDMKTTYQPPEGLYISSKINDTNTTSKNHTNTTSKNKDTTTTCKSKDTTTTCKNNDTSATSKNKDTTTTCKNNDTSATSKSKDTNTTSKNKDNNMTRTVFYSWWTRKQSVRPNTDGATKFKFKQPTPRPFESCSQWSARVDMRRARGGNLSKRNGMSMQLARDATEINEKRLGQLFEKNWKTTPLLSERAIDFDIMRDKGAPIYLHSFKWDVTSPFRFSYFTLLRNGER